MQQKQKQCGQKKTLKRSNHLDRPQQASQKVEVLETQTPQNHELLYLREFFINN